MPTCAAINCSNRYYKGCGRTFHSFPFSRRSVLAVWMINMKRDMWTPNKSSVLCADHFEETCFDKTGQTVRLTQDAVPTIFDFPLHLQKNSHKPRKPPKERSDDTVNSLPDTADVPQSPKTSFLEDHSYSIRDSPRGVKRKLTAAMDRIDNLEKKLKTTQQKSRRLKRKVSSLQEIVVILDKKNLVSTNGAEMLSKTFSSVPAAVMERMVKNKLAGKIRRDTYPPELRAFALTLHFYSAKAYRYVRKSFDLSLPHPSVIRRWYSGINGEPGFTQEAFAALEVKVEEANKRGESVVCALMLDEMAIKQHIDWDGYKYHGYVDIGVGVEDDTTPAARDALVFMVVALNSSWKLPIAYFLIDGMSGKERANLVEQCLVRLKDVGVHCVSLTCDGPSCHFTMLEALGASMTLPNLEPSFPHPADNNHRVFVLLDICHMLKLIRNTLASGQVITSPTGQKISWTAIAELHKVQEEQGLRLGNKLKASHIQWHRQKMKVNLAAQTISSSVADAIEFCAKDLKLPQFRGSDATVEFIRIIDRLFDLMNSRNPLGRHYKAPLKKENESEWRVFLQQAYTYLSQLTHNNGEPMHCSRKKTPFIGFMAGIRSMQGLFDSLVKSEAPKLQYLLTYKLSQDHLELFFCAVRSANGSNNNPTARQFASTYKRLLVRHEIQGQNGNCIAQGKTPILFVSSAKPCIKAGNLDEELEGRDMLLLRKYDLEERQPCKDEHDYCDAPYVSELSSIKNAAIGYIAGYVVRMTKRRIPCPECQTALTSDKVNAGGGLLTRKNRGGLTKPSEDVVRVCNSTERCFQRLLHTTQGALPQSHGISFALATAVLHDVAGKQIFVQLSDHMFDSPPDHNHIFVLIKCIASCYVKIRMHHLAKCCNEKLGGPKIRKQLSKLILFKHQ